MEELMNYLVAEGLSECEAKECLENFNDNVTKEDLEDKIHMDITYED